MKKLDLNKYKKLIEGKILCFATADKRGKPNLICVEGVGIVDNKILITDNCFNKTYQNLEHNKQVSVVSTNSGKFLQFKGTMRYFKQGKYFEAVKQSPINKNYHPKGAVLIKVEEVYDLDNLKKIY